MMHSLQMLHQQRNNSRAMCPKSIKFLLAMLACCPLAAFSVEGSDDNDAAAWGFSLGAFLTDQDMKTQFDIFDLSQSSVAMLSRDIEWGETVFPVSAEVSTGLDLAIYKVAYTYQMLQRDKYRLGLTGGFYVADIALRLRVPEDDLDEVGDVTAPLPVLGLRGEYFFSERWRASASAEWFGLEIDEYKGKLRDFLVGIDYRLSDHAAVGLGYNSVKIDVDATEEDLRADLVWQYSGFIGYLRFSF